MTFLCVTDRYRAIVSRLRDQVKITAEIKILYYLARYTAGGRNLTPYGFLIFWFGRKKPLSLKPMATFSSRDRLRVAALSEKRFKWKAKHVNRRNRVKEMQLRFKRSKSELEALSGEQKSIRERQRQVKEKFEAIESECEELKRETRFITQQNARTQVKLTLMLGILKARETGDLITAASLTKMLREIVQREKEEREANS